MTSTARVAATRAGVVAVEAEDQRLGDAAEAVHLLARERRATARHRVLDAGDVRRDDVEIPLDDDRGVLAHDRRTGEIEAEDRRRLVVRGRVRAVQVLRFGVAKRASPEPEHLTTLVADREDEAIPKTVTGPAALLGMDQPRVDQLLDGGAALAGQIPGQGVLAGATGGAKPIPNVRASASSTPRSRSRSRPGSPAGADHSTCW